MSVELGRRLLASGAVGPSEVEAALHRHLTTGTPFVRALLELGHLTEQALEEELGRSMLPVLKTVVPLPAIVDELPSLLCRTLLSVPVRRDPRTGSVDVATVDPYDAHVPREFAFHLKTEVRILRAPLVLIEQALARIDKGEFSSSVILRKPSTRPPSHSPPAPLGRPSHIRPSERPIPLVRRARREAVQVSPVRDIGAITNGENTSNGERNESVFPLTSPKLPRAPSVPTIPGRPKPTRARQATPAKRSSAPPATSPGPFSPKAPMAPFPEIGGVLEAMKAATTRDEVVDCLIVGMSTIARRVGVFAVKKGRFHGLACNADLGDAATFRRIEIPVDAPTVLGTAASKGSYLGPLPGTTAHEALLQFMKEASTEVAAVLIRVAGRPAVILFADTLGDTMLATRRADELGSEASRALSRIVANAKSGRGGR